MEANNMVEIDVKNEEAAVFNSLKLFLHEKLKNTSQQVIETVADLSYNGNTYNEPSHC